jgi:hypothetical protein
VAVVLAAAGVILTVFPSRTALLWAWEMGPTLTSLAVGGGYLAGAVFFVRAWRASRWHAIGLALVAATVLSTMLLVATFLHWDAFSHGHVSFWTWTIVYVAAPVLLPWLWLRNRGQDPGDAVDGPVVARPVGRVVGAAGVVQTGAATVFFVAPSSVIGWWPWPLSPLTTRTIAAFLAFVGVVWLAFLWERRWSALRLHVQSATLGLVLLGTGMLRAPGDLTGDPVAITLVVAALLGTIAGAVLLQLAMSGRARWAVGQPPGAPS